MAKTERIYASAMLDGDDMLSAIGSFSVAINNLATVAKSQNREVLFDTLEIAVERRSEDVRSLVDSAAIRTTFVSIEVSAEAVLM